MIETSCKECGKVFKCKKNELKRGQHIYCSRRCYGLAKTFPRKPCIVCGKDMSSDTDFRQKTCSKECRSRYKSELFKGRYSGSGNPFYGKKHSVETREHLSSVKTKMFAEGILVPWCKGIRKPGRIFLSQSHLWKYFRKQILERDQDTCRCCGVKPANVVHHIIPYRSCRDHKLENLITLCGPCHRKTYKHEEEFIEIFLGILRQDANGENLKEAIPSHTEMWALTTTKEQPTVVDGIV